MEYKCEHELSSENYTIQGNKRMFTSVFKNNSQIAYWKKKSFVILDGNQYDMEANYDENPVLLSAFAVLVDNYRMYIRIGGDIGWEIGNIGKGLNDIDENWKP